MDRMVDVDRELLVCVEDESLTFNGMVRLLHRLWVLDLDAVLDVVVDDDGVLRFLFLRAGVWEENKVVLEALRRNTVWWNKYFMEKRADGVYVFRSIGC